jgi:hypothetical protein
MVSKQAIEEFRVIYLKEYGVELPYAEALRQASSLIRLYKAVLPPLCKESSRNSNVDNRVST